MSGIGQASNSGILYIEHYVWSSKKQKYRNDILEGIKTNNQRKFSFIINNYFKTEKRIALFQHPINAK